MHVKAENDNFIIALISVAFPVISLYSGILSAVQEQLPRIATLMLVRGVGARQIIFYISTPPPHVTNNGYISFLVQGFSGGG